MSSNTDSNTTRLAHPQRGRRYSSTELQELAAAGDPWALCKLDEWERFADAYAPAMSGACPDQDCDEYGEAATICHSKDGTVLDIDHGGWSHHPARKMAEAS